MSETTVATGLAFPEGPAIGPDGELYVVEIAGGASAASAGTAP